MTIETFFFDDQPIYQAEWSKTIGHSLVDGVICGIYDDLFCYADASGMQVKVRAGAMHIKGHYYFNDEEQILPIDQVVGSGNSREDLVVGEVDWAAKTMSVKVLKGTEAATGSQVEPTLVRNSQVWQIQLARVRVAYGDTNVGSSAVYSKREYALGVFSLPFIIGNGQTLITTGAMPVPLVTPPISFKIISYRILADVVGSIVVDLWKSYTDTYPTSGNSICGTSKPNLSGKMSTGSLVWNESTYLNNAMRYWPGHIFINDPATPHYGHYLLANVDSVSTVKMVNLTLHCARMISQ